MNNQTKIARLVLMTVITISLFTSAVILTQNSNNIAFAKKAASTTSTDTGKTSADTKTATKDTGSKDTGKGTGGSTSSSGSTSTSSSGSGSGSTTTDNGNGNGEIKTKGNAVNTALPPDHVTDPSHITYDKCAVGQHLDSVTHACVKDSGSSGGIHPRCIKIVNGHCCPGLDVAGCGCPPNAACPPHTPERHPCNISGGNVASATCHCPTNAKCIPPKPPVNDPFKPHKCATGSHFVMSLGCVKNHLTYNEAWKLGYGLGLTDGDDQENYVGTGGYRGHSAAFTAGYNCAYGGVCPKGFVPPK